jgi:hypothetical protein
MFKPFQLAILFSKSIAFRALVAATILGHALVNSHPYGLSQEGQAGVVFQSTSTLLACLIAATILVHAAIQIVAGLATSPPYSYDGPSYPPADPDALRPIHSIYPFPIFEYILPPGVTWLEVPTNDA